MKWHLPGPVPATHRLLGILYRTTLCGRDGIDLLVANGANQFARMQPLTCKRCEVKLAKMLAALPNLGERP